MLPLSATAACFAVLVVTGIVAPIVGFLLRSMSDGWDAIGGGPFAIEHQTPVRGRLSGPRQAVDPAIQAAEVRQMLEAKASRLRRRGEEPIDVEAETTRLLAAEAETPEANARMDAELRAEVRQLVIVRNERRMLKGLEPLDVEAEIERQLEDFVGSRP
jgi:hypothetical protein